MTTTLSSPPPSPYAQKPWLKAYLSDVPHEIPPLEYHTLPHMVSQTARTYGAKTAFSICLPNGLSGSLTFNEVDEKSTNFAYYLLYVLGLKKGDRVAIQMPNCLSYPIATFGILKAGLVVVNINPLYTQYETIHTLNDSQAKAFIVLDMFTKSLGEILEKTSVEHVMITNIGSFMPFFQKNIVKFKQKIIDKVLPKVQTPYDEFEESCFKRPQHFVHWSPWNDTKSLWLTLEDMACLQYTGGTTGVSKGAQLTHKNILSNVSQVCSFSGDLLNRGHEIVLTAIPLYHIFSFTVNLMTFFQLGCHNVLVPSPRPISNLKKAFQKYPFTWMTGVNTLYHALTKEVWFQQNPPKHLKMSIAGGMQLFPATAEAWLKITKSPVLEGYGLSEASPVVTFNPLGGQVKSDSIGIPLPSTEMKIVDYDMREVPLNTPGEILIRGPQVMRGYWRAEEETEQVLSPDGWLCTGDIATMDDDGYLKIVDRKKDLILVSGFNVYPNEVEACLLLLEGILECAVVGHPDEICGEVVKAFVVCLPSTPLHEDHVKEHCRKFLTSYKIPKNVIFIEEIPKSAVGKILRRELRQQIRR